MREGGLTLRNLVYSKSFKVNKLRRRAEHHLGVPKEVLLDVRLALLQHPDLVARWQRLLPLDAHNADLLA